MRQRSPFAVATGLVATMVMAVTGIATASAANSDYTVGDSLLDG